MSGGRGGGRVDVWGVVDVGDGDENVKSVI